MTPFHFCRIHFPTLQSRMFFGTYCGCECARVYLSVYLLLSFKKLFYFQNIFLYVIRSDRISISYFDICAVISFFFFALRWFFKATCRRKVQHSRSEELSRCQNIYVRLQQQQQQQKWKAKNLIHSYVVEERSKRSKQKENIFWHCTISNFIEEKQGKNRNKHFLWILFLSRFNVLTNESDKWF